LPQLDEPRTVRVKFRKVGNLQYISHLDLQRTLHRILVRAGIPMWYTKGFNPHAKIVFSTPLSVGAESECELVDIRIDREMSCEKIKELLNNEVTDELRILDVYIPSSKFSDITWADYTIKIAREGLDGNMIDKLNETVSRDELKVIKKTKSGEKEVNIIPLIGSISFKLEGGIIVINAMLNVNQDSYLNPDMLLGALNRECALLEAEPDKIWYTIMRNGVYYEDGKTQFR
jgi:radical SAM-linked protein